MNTSVVNPSLSLSQTTNFRLFQTEGLQMTFSNLIEMAESSLKRQQTLLQAISVFPWCFQKTCSTDV